MDGELPGTRTRTIARASGARTTERASRGIIAILATLAVLEASVLGWAIAAWLGRG